MDLRQDDVDRRAALSMARRAVSVRLGSPAPEMPGAVRACEGGLRNQRTALPVALRQRVGD